MSVLEIILYISLGLFAVIMIVKTIMKGVKMHKDRKKGIKPKEEDEE